MIKNATACEQDGYLRSNFDKNAAAEYLSRSLEKIVSGEAVRMLHVRGTCPASGQYADRRLYWSRENLDRYISIFLKRTN